MSAQSMEREALALSQDGIPCDVSYANVRRLDAGVSRSAEDAAPLPHDAEQLARLLQQARVTQYADLLEELGVQDAADLSTASARRCCHARTHGDQAGRDLSERGPGDRRFGSDNADRAVP